MTTCGKMCPQRQSMPRDSDGCMLQSGHKGPHQFVVGDGRAVNWKVDESCDCDGCQSSEPDDWCIEWWEQRRKEATT